jgi:hypothetical protein
MVGAMLLRRTAAVLVMVAIGVLAAGTLDVAPSAAPAGAVTPTSAPLSTGRPDTECISANPRPDCYRSGEFPRSSRSHLILFGLLAAALVGIGFVVVRSVRRTDRRNRQVPSRP